jgi:hypothetical protein
VASTRSSLLELYHHARCASKLPGGEMLPAGRPALHVRPRRLPDFDPRDGGREGRRITHLVQAVRSDGVREEVGDGAMGLVTATATTRC